MRVFLFVIVAAGMFFSSSQQVKGQAATFDVEFIGFSAEAETAFNFATDIWSNFLISDVPIKIVAHLQTLLPGQLGITFPNGEINFDEAPYPNYWYASCLANSIAGTDLNGDDADIEIYISSTANWYFGLDENPGPGEYDFVSTVLHEICHGLGFLSLSNKSGTEGSFGLIYASSFFPLTTTFIWPELDTMPGIFDKYLEDFSGVALTTYENPSTALGDAQISNNLYFDSPEIILENDGIRPKIYAPATFTLGSSLSHWDETTYPVGSYNEFMTPKAAANVADHMPGILTLTVLEEIGWEINYDTFQVDVINIAPELIIYPNPSQGQLFIDAQLINASSYTIIDMHGKICKAGDLVNNEINIRELKSGVYVVVLKRADGEVVWRGVNVLM